MLVKLDEVCAGSPFGTFIILGRGQGKWLLQEIYI